jgi:hypothetical protein
VSRLGLVFVNFVLFVSLELLLKVLFRQFFGTIVTFEHTSPFDSNSIGHFCDDLMADRQRRCFRLSMVICECMCWADRPELVYNETSDNKLGPFNILTEPKLDCRAQTRVVEVSFSIVMTKTAKRNWRSGCQSCVHDGRPAPESKLQRCPKM